MKDRRLLWPLGVTSGICWASWIYFLFIFDVGSIPDPWDPWRIVYYVLLLLAPAITFVPIAVRLRWFLFIPYAILGWAVFGYLLAFIPPPAEVLAVLAHPEIRTRFLDYALSIWYFFLVLFVVLTTIIAPVAYAVGQRLFTSRTHRWDIVRAWREAGLLSLWLVGLTIGRSLGLLTWPIALLSLLWLVVVEALFLARKE